MSLHVRNLAILTCHVHLNRQLLAPKFKSDLFCRPVTVAACTAPGQLGLLTLDQVRSICFGGCSILIPHLCPIATDDDWETYINRLYGTTDVPMIDPLHHWLFGATWPHDIAYAIKRAAWVLQNNLPVSTRMSAHALERADRSLIMDDPDNKFESFQPDWDYIELLCHE